MATVPLFIGEREQAQIAALIDYAVEHKLLYAQALAMSEAYKRGERPAVLPNRDKTIHLPTGYDVTFTIEEHQPNTPYRHLSVSLTHPRSAGRVPSQPALEMIMQAFGFVSPPALCVVYTEEFSPGRHAINVLEPLAIVAGSAQPS